MNVLLAIDDDPVRDDAIAAVRSWLPGEARVVVLHVTPSPAMAAASWAPMIGGGLGGYPYLTPATWPSNDEVEASAREVAGRAAEPVGGQAVVEQGPTSDTIIDVAESIDADLIVVGTGDRSWWSTLMAPSVGTTVAREAPCSVLLVRRRAEHEDRTDQPAPGS